MNNQPRLARITCFVNNPIKSATLWENLLGLERKVTHEFAAFTESEGMGIRIAFANHGIAEGNYGTDPTLRTGSGNMEITLEVDDVAAWHKKALDLGFTSVKAPEEKDWGQTVCYLRDPSGIRLSFESPGDGD